MTLSPVRLLVATLLALPAGVVAAPFDLAEALQRAGEVSGSVQGSSLDRQARQAQARAVDRLGMPVVGLSALAARTSASATVDTTGVAGAINPLVGGLGSSMGLTLPTVANSYQLDRTANLASAGLTALWPVYTGGKIDAIKDLVRARAREGDAAHASDVGQLSTQVAERYFSVQLARQALALREEATAGMVDHVRAAQLLESRGLIARSDRLRADVALAGARQEEAKARNDLDLAEVALRRVLAVDDAVQTTTPLFVHSRGVGSLQSFIDAGKARHPVWARLDSKREQADASLRLQGHRWTPSVTALANYNRPIGGFSGLGSSWVVGLQVSVPLYSAIDHEQMRLAARLDQQRVELGAEQADRDIPTLVESRWRQMENARHAFLAAGPGIELARETLRLSRIAFAESQSTVLDVTDAELNLARARIERSRNAYDYVLALAGLLEACGEPERLATLAADADIRVRHPDAADDGTTPAPPAASVSAPAPVSVPARAATRAPAKGSR